MKKTVIAGILAAFTTLSCSSLTNLQNQTFDDGIYLTQARQAVQPASAVSSQELDNLLAESETALAGAPAEPIAAPAQTLVIKLEDPYYAWAGYRPWYYDSWYYDRWY
ncbi:MAG: hypothetical protein IKN13_01785, partial [Bacteroidales bacterium]|nr:hypothetical protein [Bacteroidales bacterium]